MALALGLVFAGCGEERSTSSNTSSKPHKHHHDPPHNGTGIELGEDEFHVELVLDAANGKMQAYLLSAHMAGFVRIPAEGFEMTATIAGKEETLVFKPVANSATGEKVGDTSQFEAQAEFLKTAKTFDGVLKVITIRGKTYKDVKFNFPKGNG
jgi:hypothetical protein